MDLGRPGTGNSRDLGLSLELGTPGTLACLWNWALQGPWLVSGIGHSRDLGLSLELDLGLSLELGTPGTLACLWNWTLACLWNWALQVACLWNWALQGPWLVSGIGPWLVSGIGHSRWLVSGIGHSRDLAGLVSLMDLGSLPLLLSLCKCVLATEYWSGTHLAPTAALTLQVCPDWSWQQSTGQVHTSLPLLLSLCQCVMTGPGNRVLVRHTPCSHCCSHSASVS